MISDVRTMMSGLQAVMRGNTTAINQVVSADTAQIAASTALISICPPWP
jgi:hypothetical protein